MAAETAKEMDTTVHSGYPAYTSRVIIPHLFILTCMSSQVNMHSQLTQTTVCLHSPTARNLLLIYMLTPVDRLTHLLLQQLLEGLLCLLFCVPFVRFLLKFWTLFLWNLHTEEQRKI